MMVMSFKKMVNMRMDFLLRNDIWVLSRHCGLYLVANQQKKLGTILFP